MHNKIFWSHFIENFVFLLRKISKKAPNFQPAIVVLPFENHCYAFSPKTNDQFVASINKVVGGIAKDMLENVFMSFRKRIDFCKNSDGTHFENIDH